MRARTPVLAVVGAAVVAGIWWRRRSRRAPAAVVQLGLADGAVHVLDRSDPSIIDLETLAAGVRDSLTGGA
jgi:hypothetical protein